jgi:hypothetical protein
MVLDLKPRSVSAPVWAAEFAQSQAREAVSKLELPAALRLAPEPASASAEAALALEPARARAVARPAEDATRPLLPARAWEPPQVRASARALRLAPAEARAPALA